MLKIFDAHMHIINPDYPLVENQGFVPDYFTVNDYLEKVSSYELCGGVVVSGSFQGFDQTYLRDALRLLGPRFVGVTQLPLKVTDTEILRLDQAGVKAVRINILRGGVSILTQLESIAKRVHSVAGWHVELYIDARDLRDISAVLKRLPAISIDHLGLREEGMPELLKLVEKGARVKATGFGRGNVNAADAISEIYKTNSRALLFGTDLPSTRAPHPFQHEDVALILHTLTPEAAKNVFYRNAEAWYFNNASS